VSRKASRVRVSRKASRVRASRKASRVRVSRKASRVRVSRKASRVRVSRKASRVRVSRKAPVTATRTTGRERMSMPSSRESRIAALPSDVQERLRQRLAGKAGGAGRPDGIPRRAGTGPAPLSYAQQRLWFLTELQPGGTAYHSGLALRLVGPLDVPALTA